MVPGQLGIKGRKKNPGPFNGGPGFNRNGRLLPGPIPFQHHTDGIKENTAFLRET